MNFALILFLLLVVSFIAWIADRLRFRPARLRAGGPRCQWASLSPMTQPTMPRMSRTLIRLAGSEPVIIA